ncbi:PDI1 [Candida pseudojiufengensis]|uniref:PDI1 n=1 Tax=Candida pseudojiufengensis TaxID=497109 RepID=UPI002224BB98|nr:PDI1 [Candida pseudojiufengensis]KAI5959938.1 PDI1 [Candida pseudojiufengensis]
MQFWKYSTNALATLLAIISITNASGPSEGEAIADPNSAVVKLTTENFTNFLEENPLVLTEFFAPWCGYCKMLGPEFSQAANLLNESYPNIKLAQIDCTEDESLCMENEIKGYPTLKVIRNGDSKQAEDYQGPRESKGIADYMIKQSLPSVQVPESWESLEKLIGEQTKPFILKVDGIVDDIFEKIATTKRNDYSFIEVSKDYLKKLAKKLNIDLKNDSYLIVHPANEIFETIKYTGEKTLEKLTDFINIESLPYFGEIDRDSYMKYMTSPLPIAYYFYKTPEQRESIAKDLSNLGKKYRGKLNFVGLDANLYGRHAEALSMDADIVPFFAIQNLNENKKFGINQKENPEGPSIKIIADFIEDYFGGKLQPIIKSEELPTEEEIKTNPVVKLVAHNYKDILDQKDKDIFVKYYAPWCGHCKKLAPTWTELAEIYESNKNNSEVLIADIDHTLNDVDVPFEIEGYPTLLLFPANGEIDEKTGIRKPKVFQGQRELNSLIEFIKDEGSLKINGNELLEKLKTEKDEIKDKVDDIVEEGEEDVEHDEL